MHVVHAMHPFVGIPSDYQVVLHENEFSATIEAWRQGWRKKGLKGGRHDGRWDAKGGGRKGR